MKVQKHKTSTLTKFKSNKVQVLANMQINKVIGGSDNATDNIAQASQTNAIQLDLGTLDLL